MSKAAGICIVPGADGFNAQVTGVDLGKVLDDASLATLKAAFTQHPVLSFPDQSLSPASLQQFCAQFGAFGHDPFVEPMNGFQHVIEVVREAQESAPIFGSLWHSDWSFQAEPPSATVLFGAQVPPVGGDTVFADGYRACAALSPTLRALLSELRGVHTAAPAYGPSGLFSRDDASRSMRIIVSPDAEALEVHPIIRRHPLSGRLALYINHVYTVGIEGLNADESKALLDFLFQHMTRPEFVYRHRWQKNMLVMWDNRCVVHYADGGYEGHRRLMYRATLAGERPAA